MNPELQRSLWSTFRLRGFVLTTAVVALVLLTLASFDDWSNPARTIRHADLLFYAFVVGIGAGSAGHAVVQEVRDRTWDQQRLSTIGPWSMVWAKLVGATALQWYAGLLCLSVIAVLGALHHGAAWTLHHTIFLVLIGFTAQAVALFSSLIAVRRRTTHSRIQVAGYGVSGIIAALIVAYLWPDGPFSGLHDGEIGAGPFTWWGLAITGPWFPVFTALSLVGWTIVGCHRLMRRELQISNGPATWLGFLAFVVVYAGGFARPALEHVPDATTMIFALRLGLVAFVMAAITYVTILLEPKDQLVFRHLAGAIRDGAWGRFLTSLPTWAFAYILFVCVGVALAFTVANLDVGQPPDRQTFVRGATAVAVIGFLTRDGAIIVWLNLRRPRGANIAAVVILCLAYLVMPVLVRAVGGSGLGWLLMPAAQDAAFGSAIAAWAQAVVAALLVVRTLRRPAATSPAS